MNQADREALQELGVHLDPRDTPWDTMGKLASALLTRQKKMGRVLDRLFPGWADWEEGD